MAELFVASTGSNTSPYDTWAKAATTIQTAVDAATGGDTITIGDEVFTLSSTITWNTGFGGTGVDTPLLIRAGSNGGSKVITFADGSTRTAAEIDGNDAVSAIFSVTSNPQYVMLEGLIMHGSTGSLVTKANHWTISECEFYDASGTYMVAGSGIANIERCIFRDTGGSGVSAVSGQNGAIQNCFFKNITGKAILCGSSYLKVRGCVFIDTDDDAIYTNNKDNIYISDNTFYSITGAGLAGVHVTTTNAEMVEVYNNVFSSINGAGSSAIQVEASSGLARLGPNAFHDCTTNVSNSGNTPYIDLTANDVTDTSSPFENAATDDFRIVSTANAYQSADAPMSANASQYSFGAVQYVAAGGGGGGTTSYVSVGG